MVCLLKKSLICGMVRISNYIKFGIKEMEIIHFLPDPSASPSVTPRSIAVSFRTLSTSSSNSTMQGSGLFSRIAW